MHARGRRSLAGLALSLSLMGAGILTAAPAEALTVPEQRQALLTKTNKVRANHGCPKLRLRSELNRAAQRHAVDMSRNRYFSHTSLNGTSWITRIRIAGWDAPGGENIAKGFSRAGLVTAAWMNSPGHRRNILNCKFRNLGVGYAASGHYWVQDFGY